VPSPQIDATRRIVEGLKRNYKDKKGVSIFPDLDRSRFKEVQKRTYRDEQGV
jgi:hypothetical protein